MEDGIGTMIQAGPQLDLDAPILRNPRIDFDSPIVRNPVLDPDAPILNNPRGGSGVIGGGGGGEGGDDGADPLETIFSLLIDVPIPLSGTGRIVNATLGETIVGDIRAIDDADVFRFQLEAGATYLIEATDGGNALDPILSVLDRRGNVLVVDDDSGDFLDARIVFTPTTSDSFLIAVGGFFSSTGTYELTLTEVGEGFAPVQQVALLFEAAFGRRADFAGVEFWTDQVIGGTPIDEVAAQFLASAEFAERFGDPAALSDADLVRALFENVLDRPADAAGLQFWLDLLASPEVDEADLLVAFSLSPENLLNSGYVLDIPVDPDGGLNVDDGLFLFI